MTKHNDVRMNDELSDDELEAVSGGSITVGSLSSVSGGETAGRLAKISDEWGVAAEFVPKPIKAPTSPSGG